MISVGHETSSPILKPSQKAIINLALHEKQGLALLSEANEIAYGGAAGGGKSHLGRVSAIHHCAAIPGLQTYLFRRESNELVKNHMEGVTSFPALLAPWVAAGRVRVVKNEIRFWNGSKIFLCHCQHEKDVFHWLGPEMYYLIIEQAEQFTEFMIRMLFGRNRMPDAVNIPPQYEHLFPRVLYTFNPGGVGHAFFKKNFSDEWKKRRSLINPYPIWQMKRDDGGRKRQFIQALLDDNPSVDPVEYAATLSALPPRMRAALLNGDMDQVIGAYFPDLQRDVHLIRPFQIPPHWPRTMSMDWGACGEGDPFSIGWWAVSDGTQVVRTIMNQSYLLPRGCLICYRVYRGHGQQKTTVKRVAAGILERESKDPPIVQRVAGGDIKNDTGLGTSVFQEFGKHGIHFMKADQRRIDGWQQIQERAVGIDDIPMIVWFETCEEAFETTRNLQHDVLGDANDVAAGDDHDADMNRYECMASPWVRDRPPEYMTLEQKFAQPTMNELWERREQLLRNHRR